MSDAASQGWHSKAVHAGMKHCDVMMTDDRSCANAAAAARPRAPI
jgi:hypothetical protein